MLKPEANDLKNSVQNISPQTSPNLWREAWRRLCKNKIAIVSLAIFSVICISCIAAPFLTEWEYSNINMDSLHEGPSLEHPFGTDNLGRDLLSRMLYGGRATLRISFTAVIISVVVGGIVGIACGFFGGVFDIIVMRIVDAVAAIPTIIMAIVVECALGFGVGNYMYAMAIALMPPFVRLIRTSVMTVMSFEYIEAAHALGVGNFKIILRHVIPNIVAPALIHISNTAAEAILMCTIIGYIGIGISPPKPEWGALVAYGYNSLRAYPHIALIPCVAVMLCVLSLNLLGNGLRDALDPRMDDK